MEDTALILEMIESTGKLFFAMKPRLKQMKSVFHGEMFILIHLDREDGPVMPGELSALMGDSSARTAIALRNLEKRGLIRREIDENDRRKVLVTLTEQGRQLMLEQHKMMAQRMAQIVEKLGGEDAAEYIRIVGRIVEITDEI